MDEEDCPIRDAYDTWRDLVARQEEHSTSSELVFSETQELAGWVDHQECITGLIDGLTQEVMESHSPMEAYARARSSFCQLALICFILGRQHEGAEV
jgi:hypothetical protein